MREIDHRGAELDLRGRAEERRDEHHAVGDVLGLVGEVLAAIAFAVAEPVGEDERLTVLFQGFGVISCRRMDRHDEKTEFHATLRDALSEGIVVSRDRLHKCRFALPPLHKSISMGSTGEVEAISACIGVTGS